LLLMRYALLIFATLAVWSAFSQVTESREHYDVDSAPQLDTELDSSTTVTTTEDTSANDEENIVATIDEVDPNAIPTTEGNVQGLKTNEVVAKKDPGSTGGEDLGARASEVNDDVDSKDADEKGASSTIGTNPLESNEPLSEIGASGGAVKEPTEHASDSAAIDEVASSTRVLTPSRGSSGSLAPNKTSANLQPPLQRVNLGARAKLPPQIPSKKTPLAILKTAGQKALGGGASGAAAGVVQVILISIVPKTLFCTVF